jgi:hypothetical protein
MLLESKTCSGKRKTFFNKILCSRLKKKTCPR